LKFFFLMTISRGTATTLSLPSNSLFS